MKKLFTLGLVLLLTLNMYGQDNPQAEYLLFEFMQVNDENGSDYWQVEDFWSGIHKQRVADKSIIGWDLWALTPAGTEQGSQYLTVTIFPTLKSMLQAINSFDVMAYAKKAYPNKKESELDKMMSLTVKSRDMSNQVLFKEVDQTNDNFEMKLGTVVTLDIMKQLEGNYEKAESEIFKPWHQEMVDSGKSGHWGLMRAILPAGSTAYGTHIAYSMFNDMGQLAEYLETPLDEMDMMTELGVQEGLKTREWKEKKIGTLVMMER